MLPRSVLLVTTSILFLATLTHAAAGPPRSKLESVLPEACQGFEAEEAMFCVGMGNLTFIHNGGFMAYVDRGVETAMVQTFTRDTSFYTAIVYGMNSEINASAILDHYRSIYNAQANSMGDGGFEHTSYGMNYLHFCLDDMYITLEGSGESSMECMRQAAQEILTKAVAEIVPPVAISILLILLRTYHPCHR